MINDPFHRASSRLAAIGRQILLPNQSEPLSPLSGTPSRDPLSSDVISAASIIQGEATVPLAFSITGTVRPTIRLAQNAVALKPIWGEPLPVEAWTTGSGSNRSLTPPQPLSPGLYELTLAPATKIHFLIYAPAFPQLPLQIDPLPDIATPHEGITRSPNLVGIVLKQSTSDASLSELCRSIPIQPVSYAKNLKLLMGRKLSATDDSFALIDRLKASPLVERAFIPGERVLSDGDRPGITVPVAIDRPDFEAPEAPGTTEPLLA